MRVFIVNEFTEGDQSLVAVYATEESAINRCKEIASELDYEQDDEYLWSDLYGNCIWIVATEVKE